MRAGLGLGVGGCWWVWMGVGKFRQIWAKVGKGGQVWMAQTDRVGMGDMSGGWVWVCVQV